jgi:membrane protease subunit HflK
MSTAPAIEPHRHDHDQGHNHHHDHAHPHEHHHHDHPHPPKLTGAGRPRIRQIALAAAGLWLLSGVYIVPADQQAVMTRFGQVSDPRVFPGIHIAFPWPVDRVTKLRVQQRQRLVVGGDLPDSVLGRTQPLASQFLTGDQNIINLRAVVQYSVGTPSDYLFGAQDVARSVGAAVETELARRIGQSPMDSILTTGKTAIQEEVRAAAQKVIDRYGVGVRIASINIESVTPPPEAADAFRDVANARADGARIYNEALGYGNDLVPRARGEAQQMTEAEYARASAVNGRRLYLETLEQVLPRIKKLIVDKNGNFDLTIIRKDDAQSARRNP